MRKQIRRTAAVALIGTLTVIAHRELRAQSEPDSTGEPERSGKSLFVGDLSSNRKMIGTKGGYTKRWNFGDMPHYSPTRKVSGTLAIWGNNYLNDGNLGKYWKEGFANFQPGLALDYHLPTSAIALPALSCGAADLGMTRKIEFMELITFQQVYHHDPLEIRAVRGSFDVAGWDPAFVIIVNRSNPLSGISMKQLDGVFGGARAGAYVGSVWHPEPPYSRGPEQNIRTWGQLGLTGEWADKPIHIGGQNVKNNVGSMFADLVIEGSNQFAEGYRCLANYVASDGSWVTWNSQANREVSKDPYAMYFGFPGALGPRVKELAVQAVEGGPFVVRTLEAVHDLSYPLGSFFYFYLDRAPGKPLPPKACEFLRYVLSQEGQLEVERDGRYLPLTPEVVREQLGLLE